MTIKFKGNVITVSVADVVLPNGQRMTLERVHHPGGAVVVALNDRNQVCLIRQYRVIADGWLWELPAGRIEPGEAPDVTAHRELKEEAGASAGQWQRLGQVYSSPGIFDEVLTFYLATGIRLGSPQFDEHEIIEVHWIDLETAFDMLDGGDIVDAKTLVGLYHLRQLRRQP